MVATDLTTSDSETITMSITDVDRSDVSHQLTLMGMQMPSENSNAEPPQKQPPQ